MSEWSLERWYRWLDLFEQGIICLRLAILFGVVAAVQLWVLP